MTNSVFDIEGPQISKLRDDDLRDLVARLCEAELQTHGYSTSFVTAGGHQDAGDGGIDVRVSLPADKTIEGYIPRAKTGYQVKVPCMARTEILKEMWHKGKLKPAIEELLSQGGAYVIVSAKSSVTDSKLKKRVEAMREAVQDVPGHEAFPLDFYDQKRLATWVRDNPGVLLWVKEKIGEPLHGWQPYGNWANSKEKEDAEYLLDDKCRLYDFRQDSSHPGESIKNGIKRIREILNRPQGVVRLIGLSGTGKTRLVQALFDARVGEDALHSSLAIYTDEGHSPDPSPRDVMNRLIAERRRSILVVDNCLPETHKELVNCIRPESQLSLITVEFDVGEDYPENTDVFRLEPASDDLIGWILERRAPQVSLIDRKRIAMHSGGNARLALALLTSALQRGDNISHFSDKELFERLFHQRNPKDKSLLQTAKFCSLIYSFDVRTIDSESELQFLAGLAGQDVQQFYGHVAELLKRDLVQKRGTWRAVLPHALANRLAHDCLDGLHIDSLFQKFETLGSERLLRSFSRRLEYLHDNETAKQIVQKWLSPGGFLGNIPQFKTFQIEIFCNIAPVEPSRVLETIERALNGPNRDFLLIPSVFSHSPWKSLLQSLAYDSDLFERAAQLLARFAVEERNEKNDARCEYLFNLFHAFLSGTTATIDQRLKVVRSLIESPNSTEQSIGLDALSVLFKTDHSFNSHPFYFGAHPRDYGWWPMTKDDKRKWYGSAIQYAQKLALSESSVSESARAILAKNFPDLWNLLNKMMGDDLVSMVQEVAAPAFWPEGWSAVCRIIDNHVEKRNTEEEAKLQSLEKVLRPKDLLETARVYLFTKDSFHVCPFENKPNWGNRHSAERADQLQGFIEELGQRVALDESVLDALLPSIVKVGIKSGFSFGRGLGRGTPSLATLWEKLVQSLSKILDSERNLDVLSGFLGSAVARDKALTNEFLDMALVHPILGPYYPHLQTAIVIDESGVDRLLSSVQKGMVPSCTYQCLGRGRVADSIPTEFFLKIVRGISNLPDGYLVAAEVFYMRLFGCKQDGIDIDRRLIQFGRELLQSCPVDGINNHLDYELSQIIEICLTGKGATKVARSLCAKIRRALETHNIESEEMVESLFHTHPMIALDEFLGKSRFYSDSRYRSIPIEKIPSEILISWAQKNPEKYYPKLASRVDYYREDSETKRFEWTPIALEILKNAPDPRRVLKEFDLCVYPPAWSGEIITLFDRRRNLLKEFLSDSNPVIAAWARETDVKLGEMAESERSRIRIRDESFE